MGWRGLVSIAKPVKIKANKRFMKGDAFAKSIEWDG
jgi:hypothetical protein